jgi:hypothetical protein
VTDEHAGVALDLARDHHPMLGIEQDRVEAVARLHAAGIRSLVAELANQESPARTASEPSLEAAE